MFIYQTYLTLAVLIFGINVIPVFMPPTWIILAFFYTRYHLHIIPTVILGAGAATLGRIVLAQLSRMYGRTVVPKKFLTNYEALGVLIERHQTISIPLIFAYAFFPISSNVVYIVAGLSDISIKVIALSFFVGRLISYSFWITAAHLASKSLDALLIRHFSKSRTFIAEIVGIAIILLLGGLNWRKILKLDTRFHKSDKKGIIGI